MGFFSIKNHKFVKKQKDRKFVYKQLCQKDFSIKFTLYNLLGHSNLCLHYMLTFMFIRLDFKQKNISKKKRISFLNVTFNDPWGHTLQNFPLHLNFHRLKELDKDFKNRILYETVLPPSISPIFYILDKVEFNRLLSTDFWSHKIP